MIIECINCNKVFEVNSELIPENGRTIQCGSCNHIWFYKHNDILKISGPRGRIAGFLGRATPTQ